MKNICRIISLAGFALILLSCGEQYNPLPPKTDVSVQYALPYPEKPDQDEIAHLMQVRQEHENATK